MAYEQTYENLFSEVLCSELWIFGGIVDRAPREFQLRRMYPSENTRAKMSEQLEHLSYDIVGFSKACYLKKDTCFETEVLRIFYPRKDSPPTQALIMSIDHEHVLLIQCFFSAQSTFSRSFAVPPLSHSLLYAA